MRRIILLGIALCGTLATASETHEIKLDTTKSFETMATASQYGNSQDDYHIVVPAGYKAIVKFKCKERENVGSTATSCSAIIWQYGESHSNISLGTEKTYELQSDSHIYVKVSAQAGTHQVPKEIYNAVTKTWSLYYVTETWTAYAFTITYTIDVTYEKTVPNLVVNSLQVLPSSEISEKMDGKVRFTVKNTGGAPAVATEAEVYVDDKASGSACAIPALSAGASHVVEVDLDVVGVGSHVVKIVADSSAAVAESSESDNEKTASFQIYACTPYVVRFDANGGSGSVGALSCVHGTAVTIPQNSFLYEGHVFLGWGQRADGDVVYKPGEVVENMHDVDGETVLFAIWKKTKELRIYFDANGGHGDIEGLTVEEDGVVKLPDSGYENGGAALVGWSTSKGYNCVMLFSGAEVVVSYQGSSWYGQIAGSNGDPVRIGGAVEEITLYAVWGIEASRHTVSSTVNATNLLFMSSSPATWCECDVSSKPMSKVDGASGCTSAFQSDPNLTSYYYTMTATKYGGKEYSGTNWLGAVVYGPGKLSYSPGTSCVSSGSISFAIDGDRVSWIIKGSGGYTPSGGISWWPRETYDIPEGRHFVCWCFVAENMIDASGLYDCVWVGDIKWERESSNDYTIRYRRTSASTSFFEQPVKSNAVSALLDMKSLCGWWQTGKKIVGWQSSSGKRYDDGCLVFNLAEPGETVTMTAIWE